MSYTPPPEDGNEFHKRVQAWLDVPRNSFRLLFWFWLFMVAGALAAISDGDPFNVVYRPEGGYIVLPYAALGWIPAVLAWRRCRRLESKSDDDEA